MSAASPPEVLPAHLRERTRAAGSGGRAGGELVVYWMHHAVRAEENPALDVASHAARTLGLPLLVYQGLGAGHAYDSDRHHTFIMEGARDVARSLAARGVRHVFRLGRCRSQRSPLRDLAARAALVVTEDFPVPPFPAWSRSLGAGSGAPVWLVDTACVVPMQSVGRAHPRAFAFRRAIEPEIEARLSTPWPEADTLAQPFEGPPGFEPVDWSRVSIPELCAGCAIDHAVGPVPDTTGGTATGLARWQAFRTAGLASYDRLRNDAALEPPRGVSRMSPYLHHGNVAPLRIAREAFEHGGSGARKFLDELIVWRELAHNYCFHRAGQLAGANPMTLLPEWAQATLRAHAHDPREQQYSWERLAHARTGDALWDLAQRSLLVYGELHNNLRMTWGKALVGWTGSPEQALAMLFDLNNRYALDGSDPNSYGGLLYTMGLFDRPFTPQRPVFGTVRTRSTASHARRLDLARFEARAARRARAPRVAVVGAGIAGLAAARSLTNQGFQVSVLERSRGVGGRAATRRSDHGPFDHGAQYFTARDARFARHVESWEEDGVVARWDARVVRLTPGRAPQASGDESRYVGVPGMSALAKHLAQDLDVRTAVSVTGLRREDGRWLVSTADGERPDPYDAVVVATAPEQAIPMLEPSPELRRRVQGNVSSACWAAMVALDAPLAAGFDAAFVDDPRLSWIARDSSKPGRPPGERWLLHGAPEWSAARTEHEPDVVAAELLDALRELVGVRLPAVTHLAGQRWRLARVSAGAGVECLWDDEVRMAVCGDWCLESRIESAYLSGVAAAGRVAGALRDETATREAASG